MMNNTTARGEVVKQGDLQLGDIIDLGGVDGYSTATVIARNDTKKTVTVFRPYAHVSDFAYGSPTDGLGHKLIAYTGIEQFDLFTNSDRTVVRLRKGNVK